MVGPAREVGAVVVAFHTPDLLAAALQPLGSLALVVVDNGSSDAIAEEARAAGAQYVDPGRNLGFGAAVNLGVRTLLQRGAQDVLLLNPDAVITPDAVRELQRALRDADRLAAVAPVLVDETGSWQRVAWPWPSPGGMWREAVGLARRGSQADDWLVGAALLLRHEALLEVGDFDERFFLYAEETDWQRRATLLGWGVGLVRTATATHIGGGTSPDLLRRDVLFHAGTETYVRKWFGWRGWASYRAAALVGAGARGLVLPGPRGALARHRAGLYLRGPRRVALQSGVFNSAS